MIPNDLLLDEEKIKEEEKYDGYYSIVTSELKMTDFQMREIYRGLIHIEDTFKLTKSELDIRSIYCRTNDHIDAHFTTCFTAIVLIRLLEKCLNEKYPVEQVIKSFRSYNCTPEDKNMYLFSYYDEIIQDCATSFQVDLAKRRKKRNEVCHLLKDTEEIFNSPQNSPPYTM